MSATIKEAKAIFIHRFATASEWTINNPTLYPGELGIESDTGKIKAGGSSPQRWNNLSYSTSNGSQIIDSLDIIYNDYSSLPNNLANGTRLIAKSAGAPPLGLYQYDTSKNVWTFIDIIQEGVVYFVKKKDNLVNTVFFYENASNSFIPTETQNYISITSVDKIYLSVEDLNNKVQSPADGSTYPAFNESLSAYCLYSYSATSLTWTLIGAISEQIIYIGTQESKIYQAPAMQLWKFNLTNGSPKFVRLGYCQDLEDKIGDISKALDELHNYANSLIGGGAI